MGSLDKDTFWGLVPSGEISPNDVVSVCLVDTAHSQSFSPSQRVSPVRASRLCFAPHPPIGFVVAFRAFPTRKAVLPLDSLYSLAVGPD
jgi:hypothetical protein